MSVSDNVVRIDKFLFNLYEPRLKEHFKYHPNGDYLIEQMREGELNKDEIDSAFETAEAYMAQELFSTASQAHELDEDNIVFFPLHKAQSGA
jgi:hypothetical protein